MNPVAAAELIVGTILVVFAVSRLQRLRQTGVVEVNSQPWLSVMLPLGAGIGIIVAGSGSWFYTSQ